MVGPGLFCLGFTIGTGSVTSMVKSGSMFGTQLLWVLAISAFFTWVMTEAYGRYGIVTGDTAIHGVKNKLRGGKEPVFPDLYIDQICTYSGFFPRDHEALQKWCEMETQACADLDLLGVMQFINEEWLARSLCPQAQLMPNGGFASASTAAHFAAKSLRKPSSPKHAVNSRTLPSSRVYFCHGWFMPQFIVGSIM